METNFSHNIVVVYYSDNKKAGSGIGDKPSIILAENLPSTESAIVKAHEFAKEYNARGMKGQIAVQEICIDNIVYETLGEATQDA